MKKISIIIISIMIFSINSTSYAICAGTVVNPITDVRWTCMFPISLGGLSVASVPTPEAASAILSDKATSVSPVCACIFPPPVFIREGLVFTMNNVFRMVESTKDPFCFVSLGGQLISPGVFGTAGQDTGVRDTSQTAFTYTHLISFVPTQALNLFIDVLCLQSSEGIGNLDVLELSELNPMARSDEMSLIMFPEAVLFANPIAQAYCMIDSVLTVIELTDPIGYWCAGGHSIFPLSNRTTEVEYVDAASIIAAKILFRLSRLGMLPTCFGHQAVCDCYPTLIWNKREYRLQLAKPVPDLFCHRIGKPSLIWNTPNRNQPLTNAADNLLFMIWRRRDCCAF